MAITWKKKPQDDNLNGAPTGPFYDQTIREKKTSVLLKGELSRQEYYIKHDWAVCTVSVF